MASKQIERCCECDEPTGKAGRLDDSLFDEGEGPFCEGCFHKRIESRCECESALRARDARLERAERQLGELIFAVLGECGEPNEAIERAEAMGAEVGRLTKLVDDWSAEAVREEKEIERLKAELEDVRKLQSFAKYIDRASPGEWMLAPQKDDGVESFKVETLEDQTIADTLNSDLALIQEEPDEYGVHRWDEVGRKNMVHIAANCPASTLRLIAAVRAVLASEGRLLAACKVVLERPVDIHVLRQIQAAVDHAEGRS